MISPTGKGIRSDRAGDGRYGARRTHGPHKGVDYLCTPDQAIESPISGKIVREAKPYANSHYSGCLIQGDQMDVKMFYFKPDRNLIGSYVYQGQVIGKAQDIAAKYPGQGMQAHIHLEIVCIDPELVIKNMGWV